MAQQDNVVTCSGKSFGQSTGSLWIVLPDYSIRPPNSNVMRQQPTIVGVVIDDKDLEQGT